jgi:hypothetical protein
MFKHSIALSIFALLLTCACNSTPPTQTTPATSAATPALPAAKPAVTAVPPNSIPAPVAMVNGKDACSLLTSDDLQAVQGEPLKSTKRDDRSTGRFLISICYYELPTAANSVSLSITQNGGGRIGAVRDYWEETFGKDEPRSEKEREREKKEPRERAGGEEEEEGAPMEKVSGIGDEAFWSGSRVGGALFVLKKDRYLRISVGGKGDAKEKLKRSKILAAKVLQNF